METNNKEFQQLRNISIIALLIISSSYFFLSKEWCVIICIITIIFLYLYSYQMISAIYRKIRNIVEAIFHDSPMEIIDGDLGILYEEIHQLKNRTIAY